MKRTKLHTKFGTAWINDSGYYQIKSGKEGNNNKLLHRLIWEEVYGEIPPTTIIHHKDGNKTNNCILNLEAMSKEEHSSLHNTGENHPMYCRMHSQESKQKMSEVQNTSGFFRVSKEEDPKCKQGFTWRYSYYQDRKKKSLYSIDLVKLEEKVKSKGLPWRIINKENAIQSMELNCKYHSKRKGNVIGGISTCKWCGKEYEKKYNNQACCSKECQDKLTAENSCKSSMKHYYKHKVGNTNKKAITTLGSKGTSSTSKPKESFEEEHEWAMKEAKRIGFNIKKFNGPLAA